MPRLSKLLIIILLCSFTFAQAQDETKIVSGEAAVYDQFGISVAIDGDYAVVADFTTAEILKTVDVRACFFKKPEFLIQGFCFLSLTHYAFRQGKKVVTLFN